MLSLFITSGPELCLLCWTIETFLSERNLSCDGVNGEHLAGWNPGRLLQEAEAQLGVDRAALVPVQSLHLHEWDP